jgi:hypothetical protein
MLQRYQMHGTLSISKVRCAILVQIGAFFGLQRLNHHSPSPCSLLYLSVRTFRRPSVVEKSALLKFARKGSQYRGRGP